jgi:hypothetical protein
MAILVPFDRFKDEAALVGKMLTGYAVLEIDLMHCVDAVRHEEDVVLKAMFRVRGEKRRIDVAADLGREPFDRLGLNDNFGLAIAAVHHCREIRNQYAHCVWWDDNTPQLAFRAVEVIAQQEDAVCLADLVPAHVTIPFLQGQLAYFEYADDLLLWLIRESLRLQRLPFHPAIQRPAALAQPALSLP